MTSKHEILQGMIQRLKGDRAPRAPSDLLDVDEFESKPAAQNQDNTFNKGDRVHIFGLRNAKQYNGQVGSIVTNEEDSKWLVRLDDGTEIIAKEKNLSLPVFNVNEAPRVRHTSHEREGAKTHAHLGPSSRFLNQREEGGNTPKDEVRSSRTPGCSNFDASTGKNVPCSFREQEREGNDDVNLFLKRDALPEEVKSKFPVASKAVVVGLKTATEINGRTASIIGYADDRIIVKVETISEFGSGTGSKIFKIRPKHLQALSEFFCDGQEDQTSRPRRTRSSDRSPRRGASPRRYKASPRPAAAASYSPSRSRSPCSAEGSSRGQSRNASPSAWGTATSSGSRSREGSPAPDAAPALPLPADKLREIFAAIDEDKTGLITHPKMTKFIAKHPKVAERLGFPSIVPLEPSDPRRLEYRRVFSRMDVNHSGMISLVEFLGHYGYGDWGNDEARHEVQEMQEERLRETFQSIPRKHEKYVTML